MRLLTGSSLRLPASSSFSIFFFSLALRLLCRWHAVPLAKQRKKIQDGDDCDRRASCGGDVDDRCGAGGASLPPPPPPVIEVTVNPANGSALLGGQATFTATVTNTTDTAVSWSVNGAPGGNARLGMITPAGVYTAPADMPSPATVQVTATSHADSTKSGTGTLAITSDIALALTPNPASVELGATQSFQATVTSSGHLDTSIRWSLLGPAYAKGCGTVDASGNYTAPLGKHDADSAKRGRSFEADFHRGGHHQQFFIATLRAIQRAGRRDDDHCRDDDSRSGFESRRRADLGA